LRRESTPALILALLYFQWTAQRDDGDRAGVRLLFLFGCGLRNPGER
jgi:hypothetical protein